MKNTLFLLIAVLSTGHLALAMEQDSQKIMQQHAIAQQHTKTKNLFTRGPGYWTNPSDEITTKTFSALTDEKSQREDWYAVTPYIAEFWCTLSNAGFIYCGIQQKSPELIFAGLASIISHSIPKKWLHHIDILGVGLVGLKAAREYKALYNNPTLLWPLVAAGIINLTDAYLARTKGVTWPHVTWHLSAAVLMNQFLTSLKK
jgi:hypothetical protein